MYIRVSVLAATGLAIGWHGIAATALRRDERFDFAIHPHAFEKKAQLSDVPYRQHVYLPSMRRVVVVYFGLNGTLLALLKVAADGQQSEILFQSQPLASDNEHIVIESCLAKGVYFWQVSNTSSPYAVYTSQDDCAQCLTPGVFMADSDEANYVYGGPSGQQTAFSQSVSQNSDEIFFENVDFLQNLSVDSSFFSNVLGSSSALTVPNENLLAWANQKGFFERGKSMLKVKQKMTTKKKLESADFIFDCPTKRLVLEVSGTPNASKADQQNRIIRFMFEQTSSNVKNNSQSESSITLSKVLKSSAQITFTHNKTEKHAAGRNRRWLIDHEDLSTNKSADEKRILEEFRVVIGLLALLCCVLCVGLAWVWWRIYKARKARAKLEPHPVVVENPFKIKIKKKKHGKCKAPDQLEGVNVAVLDDHVINCDDVKPKAPQQALYGIEGIDSSQIPSLMTEPPFKPIEKPHAADLHSSLSVTQFERKKNKRRGFVTHSMEEMGETAMKTPGENWQSIELSDTVSESGRS